MVIPSVLKNLSRKLFTRSFRPRPTSTIRNNTLRTRLGCEMMEDRVVPAVVDLFVAGSSGFINGAKFEEVISTSSAGTGVFNTFVQVQAASNDFDNNRNTEQGVNYDRSGALGPAQTKQYDEGNSGPHNRIVALSSVPIVTVGGVDYREFFLDNNQLNAKPFLSLDGLIMSVSTTGNLQQTLPNASPFSYDPTFSGAASVVYNMDVGVHGDSTVRMVSFNGSDANYPLFTAADNGSGKGDMRLLIPNSSFPSSGTNYVYLFSRFGYTAPTNVGGSDANEEFYANDGFEEWSVKTVAPLTKISIAKTTDYNGTLSDGQNIPEGSAISWVYAATNSGSVPLTSISVTDNIAGVTPVYQSGDGGVIGTMEVGETWIYIATGSAQSAHLGGYINIGTATGTGNNTNVSATDPSSYTPTDVAPSIKVVKSVSPGAVPETGGTVTYTFVVTNTSLAGAFDPLSGVTLTDSDPGTISGPVFTVGDTDALLEVGEVWTYSMTFAVPPGNATGGSHVNTATATGTDDEGNTVSGKDTATVTYTNVAPSIKVTKAANVGVIAPGSTVIFTYMVTNTSPAGVFDPLSSITLSDTDGTPIYSSGDVGADGILTVGETWTYSLTVTNVQPNYNSLDIHHNTVTATGKDDENNTATNTAEASVLVLERGNGRTKGFWGNSNGMAVLTNADQSYNWVAGLNALNLRNVNGSDFVLPGATNSTNAWYTLERWLKDSNATNMQFMLSAQLAATWLNTHVDMNFATAGVQSGVDPSSAVYLPAIYSWGSNSQGANLKANLYGTGSSPLSAGESFSNSGNSFVLLSEVMSNANKILGSFGTIGSTSGTFLLYRLHAEALKNVCDAVNNSYAGNTAGPGAILVSNATYQYLVINGHWVDSNGNGLVDAGEVQP